MAILVRDKKVLDKSSLEKHFHNKELYRYVVLKGNEYKEGFLTQIGNVLIIDTDKLMSRYVTINFYALNVLFKVEEVGFMGGKDGCKFRNQDYIDGKTYFHNHNPITFINNTNDYVILSNIDTVKEVIGDIRLELVDSGVLGVNFKNKNVIIRDSKKMMECSNQYKKFMKHPQYCLCDSIGYSQDDLPQIIINYGVNGNDGEHLYDLLSDDLVYSLKFINKEVFFIKNPQKNTYRISNDCKEKFIDWKLNDPIKMEDGGTLYLKTE